MNTTAPGKFETQVYRAFLGILILHALAAYTFFGLPLPWVSQVAAAGLAFYLLAQGQLSLPPGSTLLYLFIGYAACDTVAHSLFEDYSLYLPSHATTGYFSYVALRFVGLFSFACNLALAYWLFIRGFREKFLRDIAFLGGLFSLLAIYIYFAQLHGLWEPPRTRLGTGGGEQSVVFSYAFHRAMGTFREPSHLAEWLVFPLFVSFAVEQRRVRIYRALMMVALLLTGSLTGMLAVAGGLVASFFFFIGSPVVGFRSMTRFITPVLVAVIAFSVIAASRKNNDFSLYETMWARIEPLLGKGVESTNRKYVFVYAEKQPLTLSGTGLGNANLKFTHDVHLEATASFLNIFITYLLSLGVLGLLLFGLFMMYPMYLKWISPHTRVETADVFLFAAFFAWILIYFMHTEEPSLQFAVLYSLLVYRYHQSRNMLA